MMKHINEIVFELKQMRDGEHPKGYTTLSPDSVLQLCYVYMNVLKDAGITIAAITHEKMDRKETIEATKMLTRIIEVTAPYEYGRVIHYPPHHPNICPCCFLPMVKGECPLNHDADGERAGPTSIPITPE